ncbi:CBS domain-containing protein [Balneolaceae bacterium YR4-1]|uniref:CBS domain-containing protein n=1 Tax=Halalkalibaculum roseum TaxID=2709311 RepID=A0A6M1SVZ1_9BACT|nr:CBS domain-containing protein [Halalkalibaculum roseum]NGP76266.1 CBS domain-containing protein [Halalkalibaculum roseum]
MLIRNILNEKGTKVFDIEPEDTVYDAIKKMADKDIGALLVMEGEKLKGIITERDYRNKVILKGRRSKTTAVREIMTSDLYTVQPTDTVDTCMALMTDRKFRHLPVVENGKVVGVISIGDLVKAVITKQKVEIHNLRDYISGGSYPG